MCFILESAMDFLEKLQVSTKLGKYLSHKKVLINPESNMKLSGNTQDTNGRALNCLKKLASLHSKMHVYFSGNCMTKP